MNKKTANTENAQPKQRGGQKRQLTFFEKIKRRIEITRLVFSIASMLLFTAFTLIMLYKNWGSTVYLSLILGFVGLYILLFAVVLILRRKSRDKFKNSLKDYKSGLKILKSLLVLINFGLTVSVFIQAAKARDIGTPFQIVVLVITLLWAMFQIGFQIKGIKKRHTAKQK